MQASCRAVLLLLAAVAVQGVASVQAADNTPVGMVDAVCPASVSMPAAVNSLLSDLFMRPHTPTADEFAKLNSDAQFREYLGALRPFGERDWPALCRFDADNARLVAAGTRPQLVFMGDSITENWLLGAPDFFNDMNVNRGIGGQTTPQMLLRFRADVIALRPRAVHILAGTNDIAGNTGPTTPAQFRNNIMSMVDLAKANGIEVFVGSIPPAASFSWQPALQPTPRIRELNAWLREYAAQEKLHYIDYHAALAGPDDELRSELGNDGVHPNHEGYAIMQRLLDAALTQRNPL